MTPLDLRPLSHVPSETQAVLTARMGVSEANAAGDIHGGWIMKLCDDVAVIASTRHAQSRVVTLAVDGMLFRDPVKVAEVLTLKATVNASWGSSMEVGVRVEADDLKGEAPRHTLTAYFTMVALNGRSEPRAVPQLMAESEQERRRMREANVRRQIRLADLADLKSLDIDAGTASSSVLASEIEDR